MSEDRYFSLQQLADKRIEGFPRTREGWRDFISRNPWPKREVPGRGGKGGTRTEYLPPPEVQLLIDEADARRRDEVPALGAAIAQQERTRYSLLDDFVMVPRYDVSGSAGNGAVIHSEQIVDHLAFRADWVKNALGVARKDLALISVKGDSMEPTLSEGDLILVDTGVRRLEDSAIYVLRRGEGLFVKRVQNKLDGTVVVKSDNHRYDAETYTSESAPSIDVIGRVVWVGRRL